MNIYFDTEFTGLVPNTTLISLGMVAETGEKFYAEFTDYNRDLVTPWIQLNVIDKWLSISQFALDNGWDYQKDLNLDIAYGNSEWICTRLLLWLEKVSKASYEMFPSRIVVSGGEQIQLIADVPHYDMYLLCNQVFGGAFNLPSNINPVCYDICQDIALQQFGLWSFNDSEGFEMAEDQASAMEWAFDISREELCKKIVGSLPEGEKHNALYDAMVVKALYEGMRR